MAAFAGGVPMLGRAREAPGPKLRASDPDFAARDAISPFKSADDALTHAAGVMVFSLYPGHFWEVYADHAQGVVVISIPALMGATNKGVIPISHLQNEGELRRNVMRVCGEILERYQIPRAKFSQDEFLRAWQEIPLHLRGYHGHVPT